MVWEFLCVIFFCLGFLLIFFLIAVLLVSGINLKKYSKDSSASQVL